jgi:N-acetylglucosamine malate deacetylase 1
MPHRQLTIALVVVFSLWTLSHSRAKQLVRRVISGISRWLLTCSSPRYAVEDGLTLIFAPHQDDETLGCGALIARKRYEGRPVHIVFITDGGGSHIDHPHLTVPAVIALRRREAAAAMTELGVESCAVHFLDEADGTLMHLTPERAASLRDRITVLLRDLQPAKIFLPCDPDGSSEHDSAHRLIMAAVHRSGLRPSVWQYAIWSWWNPLLQLRLVLYPGRRSHLPTEDFTASKQAAIACYTSQTKPTFPWKDAVLPPELLATLSSGSEYFFELTPSFAPDENPPET